MSAAIRLSSKLPGDPEINGLDGLSTQFTEGTVYCAIAWIRPTKVTEDLATGDFVPTVEIARIEPVAALGSVPAEIRTLAAALYEERMGRTPLPFDALVSPKHSDPEEDGGPWHDDDDYDGDLLAHQGRTDVTDEVHVVTDEDEDDQ